MTRARALKQLIRARAAKTGERYTTARRHVLKTPQPRSSSAALRPVTVTPRAKAVSTPKGSMSDAKYREKTGHALDHWFEVLDRFGAVEKGHTAAARHLYEAHDVDGWYAQGITVAYERERGVRAMNQRCDGSYEVSASKVLAGDTHAVIRALNDPRQRRALTALDEPFAKALWDALDDPGTVKPFRVRTDGQGSFRYKWDGTPVHILVLPKTGGKVSIVVTNTKLASAGMVEERRGRLRAVLNALAGAIAP